MEVKICGLTNVEDARAALEFGADYLGFVLYPKSPRAVSAEEVRRIIAQLNPGVRAFGVFVNVSPVDVARTVRECGLYGAQIHGDEMPDGFDGLGFPVWRAVWLKAGQARPAPETWPAQRYVLDAAAPGEYGGSGVTADWDLAADMARRLPVMLAGGLTPQNVAEAVGQVRPLGVDVSSGVEASPGHKDLRAVKAFIECAKREGGKVAG